MKLTGRKGDDIKTRINLEVVMREAGQQNLNSHIFDLFVALIL